MKKILAAIVFCIGSLVQQGNAQDFKKVIEVVEKMEASLKTMIHNEEAKRKAEVAILQSKLQELKPLFVQASSSAGSAQAQSVDVPQVAERNEAKEKQLAAQGSAEVRTNTQPKETLSKLPDLLVQLENLLTETKKQAEVNQKFQEAQKWVPKIGVQMFSYYVYNYAGTEGLDYNKFDFERIHLTANAQVSDNVKVRFTTDLYRNAAPGSYYGGLAVRIKFAMIDYSLTKNLSLKFGLIPTHWPGLVDGFWKYRGIAQTLTDRQGYFSIADFGFSLSHAQLGIFDDVSVFVLNGNGFIAAEANRFKDIAARVTATPFPELLKSFKLASYYYSGRNINPAGQGLTRERIGGLVSFSTSQFSIASEYNVRQDAPSSPDTLVSGNGFSVFGEIKAPFEELQNKLSLVWRYDVAEPNADKDGDVTKFLILGVSYKPNDKLTFVLNRQLTMAEKEVFTKYDKTKIDNEGRWFLHAIIDF